MMANGVRWSGTWCIPLQVLCETVNLNNRKHIIIVTVACKHIVVVIITCKHIVIVIVTCKHIPPSSSDNVRNSHYSGTDEYGGSGDEVKHVQVWLVIRIIIVSIAIKCQMDWKSMHRVANALQDSQPEYLHYHHHRCCCHKSYHHCHDSSPSLPSLTRWSWSSNVKLSGIRWCLQLHLKCFAR